MCKAELDTQLGLISIKRYLKPERDHQRRVNVERKKGRGGERKKDGKSPRKEGNQKNYVPESQEEVVC